MDDDDLLKAVAQKFIDRLGRMAIDELDECAEIAAEMDDHASAKAWGDIARAAEKLID